MKHIMCALALSMAALIGAVIVKTDAMTMHVASPILPLAADAEAQVRVPEAQSPARSSSISNTSSPETGSMVQPVRILIPNSGVDARIIPVGVTKEGNLDVPPNFIEVGWYRFGPLPGELGTAVLDGHVDNGGNIPGVFKRLREVHAGDEIIVETATGKVLVFRATDRHVYDVDRFPSEEIFNDRSGRLIKIITCHGTFIPSRDTYDQRLVITARLVE